MKAFIDTIFLPILNWLTSIYDKISSLIVPASRAIDISQYLGPLVYLGDYWITFITTGATLAFIYMITFIIFSSQGLLSKFKDMVKWW